MILTDGKKKISLEEFMQLEDTHVELINGYVIKEPTPSYGHQTVVLDILIEIANRVRKNEIGQVLAAPMDVFLDDIVVQPDILFITTERLSIIQDDKIKNAPDVVFEVISPSNTHNDTKVKFDIYEKYGVKEYFLVYPEDKTVIKYILVDGRYHEQYREKAFVNSEAMKCEFNF